jgi:hypothetical protein
MVNAGCPKNNATMVRPQWGKKSAGFLWIRAGIQSINVHYRSHDTRLIHDIIVRGSRQEVTLTPMVILWPKHTKTIWNRNASDLTWHQWTRSWYTTKIHKSCTLPSSPPTLQRLPIHLVPQLSLRAQGGLNSHRCEENMTGYDGEAAPKAASKLNHHEKFTQPRQTDA